MRISRVRFRLKLAWLLWRYCKLMAALDRESKISKFSYGQFGIVRASDSQRGYKDLRHMQT